MMCEFCGCDSNAKVTTTNLQTGRLITLRHHSHEHSHTGAATHSHRHDELAHFHSESGSTASQEVLLATRVLAKNDALATANRAWLAERQVLAINLMSGPGAGKTALLERTIRDLRAELPLYVLEGDQATSNDGERIRKAGADVVQVNTGTGCHLDAHMMAHGLAELDPQPSSVVFVENVGNLVCPALFDLGEKSRVAIMSTTEGEDKPVKYPHMFRGADLIVLSKLDLLPHLDFDLQLAMENARKVNARAPILHLSVRSGQGLEAWYDWIRAHTGAAHAA